MDYNTTCNCEERRDDYLPTGSPLPPMRPMPPHHPGQHTRNYGLPLWKASDVTSWLTQMNAAMMRIDEVMHDLALRTGVNGVADDLAKSVGLLLNDVEVLKCNMADINNKAASNELLMQNMSTQMSAMHTNMSSLELTLTNLDTRIMTVESKNQNQDNSMTLIKSDLQQAAAGLKSLREAMGEYQTAANKTMTENSAAIAELQNQIAKLNSAPPTTLKTLKINTVKVYQDPNVGNHEFESIHVTMPGQLRFFDRGMFELTLPAVLIGDEENVLNLEGEGWSWIELELVADEDYKITGAMGLIENVTAIGYSLNEYTAGSNCKRFFIGRMNPFTRNGKLIVKIGFDRGLVEGAKALYVSANSGGNGFYFGELEGV